MAGGRKGSGSASKERTGRVVANHGGKIRISLGGGEVIIRPPKKERWVVGDLIRFAGERPKEALPRKNLLERESFRKGMGQPLASNLDWLVIVTASGLAFKPGLIDRFLVTAAHASIPSILVFNKIDLEYPAKQLEDLAEYGELGYNVFKVSAKSGQGLNELEIQLSGSISAMVGHSGVGKTSLLNRLCPGVDREVHDVHLETERGRHATTSALLVDLPGGGGIIDSPGIRLFMPVGLDQDDAARNFPGFSDLWEGCKFRDCIHHTEPGCAIKTAVEEGEISQARYSSYLRFSQSLNEDHEK